MARTKQRPEFEIVVDGEPYVWRLQSQPQWSRDAANWRGMAIAVRHMEGKREAVLEFPPGPQPKFGTPQLRSSQIAQDLVAKAITSALAAAGSRCPGARPSPSSWTRPAAEAPGLLGTAHVEV